MDVSIRSILESDVCSVAQRSTAVLKQALKAASFNLSKDSLWRSCLSAVKHMEAVVKAKGGHVESWCCCFYAYIFRNICAKDFRFVGSCSKYLTKIDR